MSNTADKTDSSIINVIDEFDYSTQNETYNEKFRKWRKQKDNPYAYSFEMNKKESVFIVGRGFIKDSAVEAEKEVLTHIFYIIGSAMLMWVAIDDVIEKLIVQILSIMGLDVHTSFFSPIIYGGSVEIVSVIIGISLLKTLIPLIFIHKRFKVPSKVEFMRTMNHPSGLITAIAMTLIICTLVSLPSAYSSESKEIYTYFRSLHTDVEVWGQSEFMTYTIFDIIIIPIITECFFRGAMFAVLRQFGDIFAIIMTSITAVLITQDCKDWLSAFLISAIASFGMLYSGSLFTAIAVNILFKMYQLALTIIEVDTSVKMPFTRSMFMTGVFLAGAIMLLMVWIYLNKKRKHVISNYKSELTLKNRIIHSIKTYPYSAVSAICFVYSIINLIVE